MSDLKIVNPGPQRRGRESGESGEKHHHHHKPATFARFPFQITNKTIYVRPDGSDKHGNGKSPATAFATVQFALTTIPTLPEPGANFTIDATGVNETFPAGYQTPNIIFSNPGGFLGEASGSGSSPAPWYTYQNGLTITATPELLPSLSPADAVIGAADAAIVSSAPISNLAAIQISTPRAAWAGNALKGAYIVRTVKSGSSNGATSVIYGSDPTHLFVTNDAGTLNGGAGPLVLAPGEEIQIVQPSATFNGLFQAWGITAPNFQGINFAGGLQFANANAFVPVAELCTVAGCFLIGISGNGAEFNGCNFTTNFIAQPIPALLARCLLSNMGGNPFNFYFAGNLQTFTDVVFDDSCPTLTSGFFQVALPNQWGLVNVLFQGSQGDAILANVGTWILQNVEIDGSVAANGSAGNGITANTGPTSISLLNVGSVVPNAGVGISIQDGIQVRADVATTTTNPGAGNPLSGPPGQEISIGSLGIQLWATLAAPPNNIVDNTGPAATLSRISQI